MVCRECGLGVVRGVPRVIAAAVAVAAAGCGTVVSGRGSSWETTARRPTPETVTIEVVERAAIARPYKLVGTVEASAPRWEGGPSDEAMLQTLKREARKLGGDAVTEVTRNPADRPEWWGPMPFASRQLYEVRWVALVIAWQD